MEPFPLDIGVNPLSGQKIRLPFDELKRHWHFLGTTGKGKTKALELFCRHIVDSQHALVLMEGKGDLFEAMLRYCAAAQYGDRLVVVDPSIEEWAVGLNYLELIGGTEPAVLAELVTDGLKKTFGEEDNFKPWLEEWTPPALLPLIKAGHTLAELEEIASIAEPRYRNAVLESLGLTREQKKWTELVRGQGPHEAAKVTAVVRTRASLIRQAPAAEAMFGQTATTIHWRKVLDEGGIVLVRCHYPGKISRRMQQLLGVTVMHQVLQAAFSRLDQPEAERRDAWLVCDEFQQFACSDFVDALTQLRSFKVWLALSNQELEHLDPVPGLRAAVVHQCTGKVYFSIGHEDAEAVVHDLFQDSIHGDYLKHQLFQTKFRPKETRREVTSEAHGESHSTSDSVVDSASSSVSRGSHQGAAHQFRPEPGTAGLLGGIGDMAGQVLQGTPGFTVPASLMNYAGGVWTQGHTEGSSETTSSATGRTSGRSESHASSHAWVPWYEYLEFMEESSRTYYSVEEVVEWCKRWLMSQPARRAQLKVGDRRTIPIETREVKDVRVTPEDVRELLAEVLPRCARPTAEVRLEISERVSKFLAVYEERKALEEQQEQARAALNPPADRREAIVAPPTAPAKRKARKVRRLDPAD